MNHSLKIVDSDGTNIQRECWKFDMAEHHSKVNKTVTSVYATLMFKNVVKDPVRDDTSGYGDAMTIFYQKESDLEDASILTSNMILLGQVQNHNMLLSPRGSGSCVHSLSAHLLTNACNLSLPPLTYVLTRVFVQSKATYATLSKSEFTNLAKETTESYDFTLSTIDNPYPRENSADLCNGPCAREQVCNAMRHLRGV